MIMTMMTMINDNDDMMMIMMMIMMLIFKTTRWPKTHTADIVQHGPDDLLSVLLPIQLQVNILLRLLAACILGVAFSYFWDLSILLLSKDVTEKRRHK